MAMAVTKADHGPDEDKVDKLKRRHEEERLRNLDIKRARKEAEARLTKAHIDESSHISEHDIATTRTLPLEAVPRMDDTGIQLRGRWFYMREDSLDSGTWLHDRPEKDVYRLLIDTYRMRMEDNYMHGHENTPGSVYTGAPDGLSGFQHFLQLATARLGPLPVWWNPEKQAACERLGMDPHDWCSLRYCIEKHDVVEHYGDQLLPMQLRMFGEAVYQRGPGGHGGAAALRQMVMRERQGGFMTVLSVDTST